MLYRPSKISDEPVYRISELQRFRIEGKDYILCVSNSALFESGKVTNAIINVFKDGNSITFSQLMEAMNGEWSARDVEEGLLELKDINVIQQVSKTPESSSAKPEFPSEPSISTLICILSKNCNLHCSYCYAEQGVFRGKKGFMKKELAVEAVDFLIEQSGQNREIHLTLFGGEPLLNFPVIKTMVLYGKKRAREARKKINFSMTTNATLFTEKIIEFLNNEGVGLTISIDGPMDIHDKVRKYINGKGSYKIIRSNISELFRFYKNRSVAARVTVTRKAVNIKDILFHLLKMGFQEVGFSPVSTIDEEYALSDKDLKVFTQQFQELSELYVEKAINNEYLGFSNFSNLLKQIHEGTNKAYPCGGGIGLMGMDATGELFLCHRLIGNKEFYWGNIWDGIDREKQKGFLSEVHLERKEECKKCWVRYFCGGGCYHETFLHNGTVSGIPSHYCQWLRQWFEIGMRAYIRISENNPDFIKRVIDSELIC